MQSPPLNDSACPLTPEQQAMINHLVGTLEPVQLAWIAGYLSAINTLALQGAGQATAVPAAAGTAVNGAVELTILFGSQTGNCEGMAKMAAERAAQRGIKSNLKNMGTYKAAELKKEKLMMLIVSTHGEGDPPDSVEDLYDFINSKRAPKLGDLKYSVLALGDSSYENYCQIGVDFDKRFKKLGAEAFRDRVDCDVDYDDDAEAWIDGALDKAADLADTGDSNAVPTGVPAMPFTFPGMAPAASKYDRKNPFPSAILENINVSGHGSGKENRHVEMSLEESGLVYVPGDSLGVFPTNCPEFVAEIIATAKLKPDAVVQSANGEETLQDALLKTYEVTILTPKVIDGYAKFAGKAIQSLLGDKNKAKQRKYIEGRELIDMILDYPPKIDAQGFTSVLRKLPHRLYSIASSYDAHPEEAHLLIATVRYQTHGRQRKGVATTFYSDRVTEDTLVPSFIHENPNFRLPADPATPIIMIGPGTGVAPFRAFIEQREIDGATGKNWLFFGDRRFRTDFTYQTEWQRFRKDGILTRIDLAFSRDQDEKVYVQHRMLEAAKDIYAWLQDGATIYVCGDEVHMAKDVHAALLDIVRKEGGMKANAAAEYVKNLQRDKRYQRDVY
jgi:sulfite reductase (NADPH) flavoprotein alpha-component